MVTFSRRPRLAMDLETHILQLFLEDRRANGGQAQTARKTLSQGEARGPP